MGYDIISSRCSSNAFLNLRHVRLINTNHENTLKLIQAINRITLWITHMPEHAYIRSRSIPPTLPPSYFTPHLALLDALESSNQTALQTQRQTELLGPSGLATCATRLQTCHILMLRQKKHVGKNKTNNLPFENAQYFQKKRTHSPALGPTSFKNW